MGTAEIKKTGKEGKQKGERGKKYSNTTRLLSVATLIIHPERKGHEAANGHAQTRSLKKGAKKESNSHPGDDELMVEKTYFKPETTQPPHPKKKKKAVGIRGTCCRRDVDSGSSEDPKEEREGHCEVQGAVSWSGNGKKKS